jgi:hypothetical protein
MAPGGVVLDTVQALEGMEYALEKAPDPLADLTMVVGPFGACVITVHESSPVLLACPNWAEKRCGANKWLDSGDKQDL